jgi:UDP-3-O-[3-hydroxymyristoyl] glucosamine N-acyltransferase
MIGGQVGIIGHLKIGDNVKIQGSGWSYFQILKVIQGLLEHQLYLI